MRDKLQSLISIFLQTKYREAFAWYGVVAILLSYALLSFGYLDSQSLFYQGLNLTGAICIAIDAYRQKNYQPVVLNIVWALIAIIALLGIVIR